MAVGLQQLVSRGRRWGWHCGCAELVAGAVWSAKHCSAGSWTACMGWVLSTERRKGWAAIGAGAATAQASRLTATSDQIQKSGWTGAASCECQAMT